MKYECMRKSMFRGDIVKPGTILDLSEAEEKMDVVKAFFVKVGGDATVVCSAAAAPTPQTPKGTVVAGLTREQAMMKLQQVGAKVKGNMSNNALADLYNATFANLAEATTKEG